MKCHNRYHILNIKNKDTSQVIALLEKIEEMVAQNKGQYFEISRSVPYGNIILSRNVFTSNTFRTTLRFEVGHAEVHGKLL